MWIGDWYALHNLRGFRNDIKNDGESHSIEDRKSLRNFNNACALDKDINDSGLSNDGMDKAIRMSDNLGLGESAIHRIVKESVNKILNEVGVKGASDNIIANVKESAHDYWEDAIYNYETRERLPKGWEKIERNDDEPLYIDQDGNEYVKNEYGRFIPFGVYR